jgi:hypothetical protein
MHDVVFRPEPSQYVYTFGGAEPALRVKPGCVLRSVTDVPSEKIDIRYVNPQTGPFYVEDRV